MDSQPHIDKALERLSELDELQFPACKARGNCIAELVEAVTAEAAELIASLRRLVGIQEDQLIDAMQGKVAAEAKLAEAREFAERLVSTYMPSKHDDKYEYDVSGQYQADRACVEERVEVGQSLRAILDKEKL